jgi:hypothetical protein
MPAVDLRFASRIGCCAVIGLLAAGLLSVTGAPFLSADPASGINVSTSVRAGAVCVAGGPCAIGDTGPGGGIVFYDAGSVQPWGRYLEAAPAGWNGGPLDPSAIWCSNTTTLIPGAMGTAIGTGAANTANMLAACSSGAANLARSYISPMLDTAQPDTAQPDTATDSIARAPRGVRVVAGQGLVTVSWQPPSDNGGSKVTKYVVTATPGARSCSTSGSSCRVTGLSGGKTYTFDVVARNGVGAGEPATSKPVRVPTAQAGPVAPPPKPKPTFRLIIGGKSDWFLPSKDELNALHEQRATVGGFGSGHYWSSSQYAANSAWAQNFTHGSQYGNSKNGAFGVRPVRAF